MIINRLFMSLAIVVLSAVMATKASAQYYTPTKEDYKAAKKEAKEQKKQGWKVSPGDLSLEEQIANSKAILRDEANWIIGSAISKGTVYDVVQSNALFQAKANIAKNIDEKINGYEKYLQGNDQKEKYISASEYTEVAKAQYNNGVRRPKYLMRCYRNNKDNTVEVLIRIAIPWEEPIIEKE